MTATRPVMIFHAPFLLNPDATSASGIRPLRMRNAFEAIGYEVYEISGRHAARREQMKRLRELIAQGLDVDFVYSEAATVPTGLGEPVTSATSLTRDIAFLRWCRRRGIPVGLFYRDIYWRFKGFGRGTSKPMLAFLRWRYRADLRGYRSAVDRLYLPSLRMTKHLPPGNRRNAAELPPGAQPVDCGSPDGDLSLLYVGGMGRYYRLQETVRGTGQANRARLTVCTRESEWISERDSYSDVLSPSTEVIHASGDGLEALYEQTHIGSLLMEPIPYREFAAPMKLYEYIGHGKPVIVTEGSLAAELVAAHRIGWAIPYRAEAVAELLNRLTENPAELRAATERVIEVREQHTWEARAEQVASELLGLRRGR